MRGIGPIAAISSSLMPSVMNWANAPWPSGMPSAAKRAPGQLARRAHHLPQHRIDLALGGDGQHGRADRLQGVALHALHASLYGVEGKYPDGGRRQHGLSARRPRPAPQAEKPSRVAVRTAKELMPVPGSWIALIAAIAVLLAIDLLVVRGREMTLRGRRRRERRLGRHLAGLLRRAAGLRQRRGRGRVPGRLPGREEPLARQRLRLPARVHRVRRAGPRARTSC